VWDTEGMFAPGESGQAVGAIEGAEEGFGARFHDSGEGDSEFSYAQPAGATVPVARQ